MPLYGKIIVIKRTGADGYNFPLTSSSCLFGRKTDCDIRIQLPHVSKEHCKLEVNENNEVILTNLSEVNRTCLNGQVVLHSERLKHRDMFTVIDRSFRFEYPLDSVHNTSPRKKRNSSSLKNETLQGVDDGSQPSGKGRQSTSGRKSDTVDVDKVFEVPTKSEKATPNARQDPAPKNLRRRSATKILNDEQPTDQGYLSPFSKLYEMFKQQTTKPIQTKPKKINMHISVKESSSDLTKQSSVPAKASDVTISQYDKSPRASPSARRTSGRMSKIRLEERKMAKDTDSENEEMSNQETPLVHGIATAHLAKPTPKKNNASLELNKFTENLSSEAKVTSLAFSDVGVKGKEQNNHLSTKGTPKAKQKSQHFTTRRSLTANEALMECQEMLEPSVGKEQSMVMKNKTIEMEHTPFVIDEKKAETPKKPGRPSLHNKNVEAANIQAEQAESAEIFEPSAAAKSEVEDKSVEMEHTHTPKKRGRPSLRNKNVEAADIQAESAEVSAPSVVAKTPALIKQKSGTSSCSLHLLSETRKSDAPENLTKAGRLKKKSRASKSPQRDLTNEQSEKRDLMQEMPASSTISSRWHSGRQSITSLAGEDHVGPMNTATEQLGKSSVVDAELDFYTSSKASPSPPAAVPYLSKKRRSEKEEKFYGPVSKRKKVSFGANLSPELFDKRMPPSSPLRKGGTPTRVSTPFRCTPRAVVKRASSMGIHTCTIQEFSELNENYSSPIRSKIPSARASPEQTRKSPAKIPSSGKVSSLTTGVKSPAKRPSSVKTPSLLVVKQSPDAKTPLPSIKRSPAAKTPSQSKTTSSATKKSSVVKVLSSSSLRKLVTNKMSSPIAGSFDCSPNVRGRFSISHVATPPVLTRSMSPHITPTSLKLAMFEQPQQKASLVATSGKKPSRKSASLFAALHSRRQTGASAANLLVKKSWAQVVKEGVAKPQLRCAGKKSVVTQRRTKNIVSLKVVKTPVRLVKGHFSTGHAASPATIVIGKSQATTIEPTGQAPRIVRTVSLRRKDYEMNESFTGITEMFSTPTNENEKAIPVLCTSNIVDDAQTALTTPISQKSFEDSVIKTPEETGEMDVSPLTSPGTRSSKRYNNAVSRLLRCRADFSSSSNDICESIPKVPNVKGKPVEDMDDVQRIMKTPKVKGKPVEDTVGVQRIMKSPRVKGKPVEDMVGVQRIMKTPRVKGKPVEDMVGVKRIMKTPRVKGKPVEDMVGVKRIMKTPRVKEKPVKNFVGLHKLMTEPKQKAESPEISYVGIKKLFHTGKEMENCDYSGLGEMFSTPIRTERSSDSEQQQSSKRSANKKAICKLSTPLEKIYGDGQTTETSEYKLTQIVEQRSGQPYATKTSPRGTAYNLSLTPGLEVTRTRQAKSINSPSSKECMQQPDQPETSQTFPTDGHVDFREREINESEDGQFVVNKLISPRKSLKEKKEIQNTGAEESPTTIRSTTPGKNGSPAEQIEEVSKIVSTRKSLKGKKIEDVQDANVKMLLAPSKTTPGKKESPHEQTEEVIVLTPQTRRSLKEKSEIQNIQDVELEELPASIIMSTTSSKNESPGKKSEEVNKVVSPIMKSLRGMKKVQGAEMKELFTFGKTTTLDKKESQDGQTGEVNEMALSVRKSLEGKKETQNVEVLRPPTSAKACTQDKKQTPVAQIEEVVHLTSRERSQRRNKETESTQNTEVKELPAVAKTSQGKKETQYAKIEELDKSSLRKISQKKNEIENIESVVMKDGLASPKTSIKGTEKVKDLPVENVKAPITTGRPQRRKNINVEETAMQKPPGTRRKRGARVENVKESISLQRDQKEVDEAEVNSGPEGSVREGVKTENVKILDNKDLARSTRGKRANKDLLLEEFKQDSVPVKRLRKEKEEKLEEASLRKAVHWVSNLTSPKLADCAVEILQETFNGTELPVLERRSRKGRAAKKEVNPQVSLGSVETSRKAVSKHENSKVITDANQFLDSVKQQKERPKRKKADIPCEPQGFTKKDKNYAENVNDGIPVMKMYKKETNQYTESVLKLSPTPIKRLLRGKVGQKVIQNKENVKELSSTRKSKRNVTEQKFVAAPAEEPHVPVKIPLGKEEKHKMTEEEYMPSSRTMGKGKKGKQTKESLVEGEAVPEQTEQQLNMPTVDMQLDNASEQMLLQENEPTAQKVKSKVRQRAKASAKGTVACLSNVEAVTVGEMGVQEKRSHLDVCVGGSDVVNNSDIISKTEATKQTRFPSKGKVTNTAAKASEMTSDTKKMDVILSHRYEIKEDTRPKRSVRKGRSAKEIATESEVKSLVPDTAEETAERWNLSKRAPKVSTQTEENDAQKTKSDKKLSEPAINKRSKKKITKEDAPSVVQEICEEGLQVKDAADDPVEAPRRGGRGMVKRNISAVIDRGLSLGTTEDKQVVESSVNNAEKNQRSRRGQNCYDKGTAILSVAQEEKDELINKRGRRPNLEVQINNDQNVHSRKNEVENKGKKQEIEDSTEGKPKPAKRATRANKPFEAAKIEQTSVQPLASASLTPASLCPSKRTIRGKRTVAETAHDVSPKKSKMEKMTGKVMTQARKTGKAAVSTEKRLPVTPQPAKPSGRITRSRK
ncbi:proliferation marker protein Ki-67 isoform X2 [Heptranchias perlo]|uniref:proliferation marker protein Ki-67 isoform X2 n=1 Tax=Heptranchias perlo TaxID=212740 RepID=UPI00355AAD5E